MTVTPSAIYMSNSSKTLANSTTETSLFPSGTLNTDYFGSRLIPAGQFFPGKFFIIQSGGVFSTILTPGTFTLKVKLISAGATKILSSVALTNILSNAANNGWDFDAVISCRTAGTSGTVVIDGHSSYATTLNSRNFADFTNAGSAITFDTTVDQTIDITGTWTTANTGNTFTTTQASIEQFSFS